MSDSVEFQSLLSSAGLVFLGTMVASVSRTVERIVIARFLSPSAYGEVNIALAVLMLGTTLSMFGFTQGIPRFMSRFDDEQDVRGTWLTGFLISEVLCLGLVVVLLAWQDIIVSRLFDSGASGPLYRLVVLSLPFVVGLEVAVSGIRGMENTIYRTYAKDLAYPVGRIVLVLAVLLFGGTVASLGYAYLIAGVIAFVVALVLFARLFPLVGAFRTRAVELVRFSLPLVLATILVTLLSRTDTLMIGYFDSSAAVGLYNAAYPLANTLVLVLSSFGFLYLPLASRLDADDDRTAVGNVYQLTTKWIFVLTFPAFLVLVSFPSEVIGLLFGTQYRAAGTALVILSVGFFTNAAGGRNRETLSALGYPVYNLLADGIAFLMNIVLNVVLIPRYGYVGAAVASAISYIATNVLTFVILQRKFAISPFSTWFLRTSLALPIVLVPIGLGIARAIPFSVFVLPFVVAIFALLTLLVVVSVGGVQPEDRFLVEFVEGLLGRELTAVRRYIPDV